MSVTESQNTGAASVGDAAIAAGKFLAGVSAVLKAELGVVQGMEERQIRAGSHTCEVADPFFVLATQNPIEQEGTYPLPEAQLDRFMFMVMVNYPSREEELEVLKRTTGAAAGAVKKIDKSCQTIAAHDTTRRERGGERALHVS